MKKRMILAVLVLTAACAAHKPIAPVSGPDVSHANGALTGVVPIAQTAEENTPPLGADISDHPVVQFLVNAANSHDAEVGLQIAAEPANNDKAYTQCLTHARQPDVQAKAVELVNVKGAVRTALAAINAVPLMPIKPIGPLSLDAEARRVRRDIASGAAAGRVLQARAQIDKQIVEWRSKLASLLEDFNLACGPYLVDERAMWARVAALVAGAGL